MRERGGRAGAARAAAVGSERRGGVGSLGGMYPCLECTEHSAGGVITPPTNEYFNAVLLRGARICHCSALTQKYSIVPNDRIHRVLIRYAALVAQASGAHFF